MPKNPTLPQPPSLQNQGLTRNLQEREQAKVGQVVTAFQRMEEGTYGRCAHCGGEIPFERLLVFPETPTCTACSPLDPTAGERARVALRPHPGYGVGLACISECFDAVLPLSIAAARATNRDRLAASCDDRRLLPPDCPEILERES